MEDHENEERELTTGIERALASAIATAASLVEAYHRRRARQLRDAEQAGPREVVKEQVDIQQEARADLAARRDDGELWLSAPYEMLNDQVLREHGIDPRRVGEAGADKQWITRAPGSEVLAAYDTADRWASRSDVARSVRENIADELASYGLDLNDLLHQPRGAAAEQLETARAQHWAQRGFDPEGTPAERADADRDAEHVEQLLDRANGADQSARDGDDRSEDLNSHGDAMSRAADSVLADGTDIIPANRSEQASEHSGSTAGRAAAVAATDHPTRPRDAVTTAGKKRPRVKPARPQPNRERGHGR
ncbi:hypothetical protein [Nocardia sp. 348MFTsu5.1]|uniref:hypothetical protein n=1 Tax=Nocardia sp. 348MFTsu5.1 TaxID=1172185 RepID=UPI0003758316|nr:hypothetical protein [Nocardia sp. 348MFTsu5.1]